MRETRDMDTISFGYPNTIMPGSHFARYTAAAGHQWNFLTESSMRVSKNASGTRNVDINPGWLQGGGIMVQNPDTITKQVPAPSGASQWHCLVLRLWVPVAGDYVSEYHWVSGSSTQELPELTQDAENQFDIPIALARTTSGSAQVTHLIDLRVVGNSGGGVQIYDDLVMPLLQLWYGAIIFNVTTKSTVMIARDQGESMANYKRLLTATEGRKVIVDNSPGKTEDGWGADSPYWCQARSILDTRLVQVQVALRRWGGGDIPSNSNTGGMPNHTIYEVKGPYIPYEEVTGSAVYYSKGRATYGATVTLSGSGKVVLHAGAPGVDLPQINAPEFKDKASIRATFIYLSRD